MDDFNKPGVNLMKQNEQQSQPIHRGYIPPGKFIDIDHKIYSDNSGEKVFGTTNTIQFGGIPDPSTQLINNGLPSAPLVMNFGTYLYNQITGTAANQL